MKRILLMVLRLFYFAVEIVKQSIGLEGENDLHERLALLRGKFFYSVLFHAVGDEEVAVEKLFKCITFHTNFSFQK